MNSAIEKADPPDLVFHYTKYSTFLEIAESGSLLLGPLRKTNDPYEREHFYLDGTDRHMPWEVERSAQRYMELDRQWANVRNRYQVFCGFSENHPQSMRKSCTIDGRTHLPMWAHYGQDHLGVCLVINRRRFTESLKSVAGNVFSGFVEYTQLHGDKWKRMHELPNGFWSSPRAEDLIRQHVQEHHRGLFFRKSPEWKEEAEWRWVVDDWKSDSLFVPLNYSLESVVLGYRV